MAGRARERVPMMAPHQGAPGDSWQETARRAAADRWSDDYRFEMARTGNRTRAQAYADLRARRHGSFRLNRRSARRRYTMR